MCATGDSKKYTEQLRGLFCLLNLYGTTAARVVCPQDGKLPL